ncbi:hypothetical protein G7075_18495 [Phycicoccus sp. HDW14]|uniref:hypothetical protein n=1 Tax=Phycicoccus sp. HDW14 TaxID=2714941 RepID=UPI0014082242|nr:hypothetical protein [Phycicoccus sp. HDW14]QIM22663.1 hypothetical protein G7075_18495 [Phycicoccus sp. HDW14]
MTDHPRSPDDAAPNAPELRCPLCANTDFQREESRQDSRWGFTSHRMTLLVCTRCRYVLHFYDAHSIFDID